MILTLQSEPLAKDKFDKFRGGFYLVQRAVLFHDVEVWDESATFNDAYVTNLCRSVTVFVRIFGVE